MQEKIRYGARMVLPNAPSNPRSGPHAHLLVGLVALALAIGVAGTVSREVGGVLLIAAWALLVWSIHRLGRSGPAPAIALRSRSGEELPPYRGPASASEPPPNRTNVPPS